MSRARALVHCVLALAVVASTAWAQAPVRTTVENRNSWYAIFGDHRLSGKWSLSYDVQARRTGIPGSGQQQLLIRPGITYDLTPDARITFGYASITTDPYGGDPVPVQFPEHRLWQQLMLTQRAGPVRVTHRFRMEERFIGVMTTVGQPGVSPTVDRWRQTNRVRYFVRGLLPFGGMQSGPYVLAYDEIFIGIGKDVQLNIFEQNRVFVGAGWRFSPTLRADAGYLEQQIIRASGTKVERNHTLVFTLTTSAPFGQ